MSFLCIWVFFFTLYFNDIYMFMHEKEKLEIKVLEFWGRDGYHWLIDSDVRSHFLSPAFLLASFFLVLGGGLQRTCAVRWRVLNVSDHHLNWLRSTLIHGWEIKNVLSELNRNMTFYFYNNNPLKNVWFLISILNLFWRKKASTKQNSNE